MKTKSILGVIILLTAALLCGCATYGTHRRMLAQDKTIETLAKNWQDYAVYWRGISMDEPTGIMFSLRTGPKALTGERWQKVESEESLLKMIGWLKFNTLYPPFLWGIVGPDGQICGYIYTGYSRFVVRSLDEKTMEVYGLPATLRGGGGYGS